MIGLIKVHKPAKFHQYTICTFVLPDLQNPRRGRFGPPLGGFANATSRIEVQLGAPPYGGKNLHQEESQIVKDYIKKPRPS